MSEAHLSRLYYASTATEKYSPMEIGNILDACRHNNPSLNVTGMLFYGNRYFLQCLEGPRRNINITYAKLLQDQRHDDVQILDFKEIATRYFEEWSMKYIRSTSVITKIMKETGLREFNPYLLDSYTLDMMGRAFRDYAEPVTSVEAVESKEGIRKKATQGFKMGFSLFKR